MTVEWATVSEHTNHRRVHAPADNKLHDGGDPMHTKPLLAAASSLLLAACAQAPILTPNAAQTAAGDNPFFEPSPLPYGMPPFDRIRDEHYKPALEAGMAEQRREIEAIRDNPEAPSFENTIEAMERSGRLLDRVSRVFFNLAGAHTNDTIQAVQAEMAPKLAAHSDAIYLDAALFARVHALFQQRDKLGLSAEQRRLLEMYHRDFVRAGAQLDEASQQRLREINAELSSLSTAFGQNLLKGVNAATVFVSDPALLDGLGEDGIARAKAAAEARGRPGEYALPLMNYSSQPYLKSLRNRELRKRIHEASLRRGIDGGEFDQREIILKMVRLRAERAALLGYRTFADYQLETQTARTTKAVNDLLASLTPAAVRNARAEAAELQKLIDAEGGGFKLAAWDWPYYAEKLRKARYDFDESQTKPYFELNRVLVDGVFHMAKQVYGLSFQRRDDLPTYHPDVSVWEVFNEDGSPLGLFLFDPFARESKRGGAWMNAYVSQSHLLGTRPVVANHLNIPKPPEGEPALLSFDEVNTMFHEFGHALHGLFSDVTYPYFSGTSVPRDFVEYPSQVHEMWMTWPSILANYAVHYQTGEPMPRALVDKIEAAEKFNQGYATTEYLAASLLDQAWHQLTVDQVPDDVVAFERQALARAGALLDEVPTRYRSGYFAHIFAGGYAAGYYSYIWSEVLDADTVEWFKEQGGAERINGDWFRAKLLSRGGSRDAMELFRQFRGRDPRIEPLLERRGLN